MGGPEGNIEQCPCEKKEAMETQTGEIVMGQLRQEGWHFYKKRDGKDFWQPPRSWGRDQGCILHWSLQKNPAGPHLYLRHLVSRVTRRRILTVLSPSSVVLCLGSRWTVKKDEQQRVDAFKLWCWRTLLRVLWTARRSNQSFLKEIHAKQSLEGPMLKPKLQYFGHLMPTANS